MKKELVALLGLACLVGCGKADKTEPKISTTSEDDDARVVYRSASGRVVTLKDLGRTDGEYKWEVVGGKPISPRAKQLHEQARKLGSEGNLDKAVELLKQASDLAPEWAYPSYDLAYTYLLMGKDREALELYERVDRIEPRGFFTAKTGLWALRKEKESLFPKGTYLAYLKIEWAQTDAEKLKLTESILVASPTYAPALKEKALLGDEKQKMEWLEKALAADPDGETYGILMVNKAAHLNNGGNQAEAIKILGELILSSDPTLTTVATAKSVLGIIVAKK